MPSSNCLENVVWEIRADEYKTVSSVKISKDDSDKDRAASNELQTSCQLQKTSLETDLETLADRLHVKNRGTK